MMISDAELVKMNWQTLAAETLPRAIVMATEMNPAYLTVMKDSYDADVWNKAMDEARAILRKRERP